MVCFQQLKYSTPIVNGTREPSLTLNRATILPILVVTPPRPERLTMGEYTTFECRQCGYTAERIRWGVSAYDPRQRFMPGYCVECGAIVEVDLTGADLLIDEFRCVVCGCELAFLDKASSYACPKCKAEDMMLHQGEYW